MQEKVDPGIDAQLTEMINQLMFKKEKPDEDKLKEKLGLITRPDNCNSLVTTKIKEPIWQRPRPQTGSFNSRAQVAQTCVVRFKLFNAWRSRYNKQVSNPRLWA